MEKQLTTIIGHPPQGLSRCGTDALSGEITVVQIQIDEERQRVRLRRMASPASNVARMQKGHSRG
jgi:hypothetical protein